MPVPAEHHRLCLRRYSVMQRLRALERPVATLVALSVFVVAVALALIAMIALSREPGCLGFDLQPRPCETVVVPGAPGHT